MPRSVSPDSRSATWLTDRSRFVNAPPATPAATKTPISGCVIAFQEEDRIEDCVRSLAFCDEVIVVDSQSTDGTLEYLKKNLHHPRVKFLDHPPGLYESWNYGLEQINAPFTYISTVGDTMPAETLRGLVEIAQQIEADAVISAPDFVDEKGQPITKLWPIQLFLDQQSDRKTGLISNWEWYA